MITMENEPVERSVLRFIHFKQRLKWLRENNEHIHEIIEEQIDMPRFIDLYKSLGDIRNKNPKKSLPKML
jgi:hypothetical protein